MSVNATDSGENRTAFTNSPRGTVVSENIPVGQPGCLGSGGAVCTYYYLHDGSGSTMALVDSRGTVTNNYSYDPWGKTITGGTNGTVPNPFRYDGAMLDPQTGLYKMSRRYYDPTTGRFLQRGTGSQPYACKDARGAREDTCGEDEEFLLTHARDVVGSTQAVTIQAFAHPQENGDVSFVLRVSPNGSRLTGILASIQVVVNGRFVDYGRLLSHIGVGSVRHMYPIETAAMYVGNGLIVVSVTVQNFTLAGAVGPNYYVIYVFCLNVEPCPPDVNNYQNP